jgi:membrane-associated phospholipid phosphatase
MPTIFKQDGIQQAIQSLAYTNSVTEKIAIFCAAYLVFVMAALWVVAVLTHLRAITPALLLRLILLVTVAFIVAKVLNHVIIDTRPYIVTGTAPLASVSRDNGFPSDHTLMAAAITVSLWWISRKLIPFFALGTLLVMLGRMGIGAHHTLDVVGSVVIVLVVFVIVALMPLPAALNRSIFASRKPSAAAGTNDFDAPTQPNTLR